MKLCQECGKPAGKHRSKFCAECRPWANSKKDLCEICGEACSGRVCGNHVGVTQQKIERNEAIVARYQAGEICSDLAREYGIKRERVRQILEANDVLTPCQVERFCNVCGKPLKGKRRIHCSDECVDEAAHSSSCWMCGEQVRTGQTACKKHCQVDPWWYNRIVDMAREGMTQEEIADRVGSCQGVISRAMLECGVRRGKGWWKGDLWWTRHRRSEQRNQDPLPPLQ